LTSARPSDEEGTFQNLCERLSILTPYPNVKAGTTPPRQAFVHLHTSHRMLSIRLSLFAISLAALSPTAVVAATTHLRHRRQQQQQQQQDDDQPSFPPSPPPPAKENPPENNKDVDVATLDTLSNLVTSTPEFSILAKALAKAGLLETLAGRGPFTLFAPNDAAFEALPPATLARLMGNTRMLKEVLLRHVLKENMEVRGKNFIRRTNGLVSLFNI
jgi:uncharacterized surface protein with fasciclin (FAS1) repeats